LFQLRFCYSRSSSTGDNNEKVGTTSAITPSDTQLSTLVTSKDINPKEVAWTDIVGGGKLLAKPGEAGQMVKLVVTICCIDAMLFNMEQLQQICSNMKLMGYQSKPKANVLQIIGVRKLHQSFYDTVENNSDAKAPAKTCNSIFWLTNVVFSDKMSLEFEQLDENVLDAGLVLNDEFFWQEVAEKFKEANDDYESLAFV
jgi:hypothetical protein